MIKLFTAISTAREPSEMAVQCSIQGNELVGKNPKNTNNMFGQTESGEESIIEDDDDNDEQDDSISTSDGSSGINTDNSESNKNTDDCKGPIPKQNRKCSNE
ncbi:unnamed protein product [Thelazia callipaeda]|uniref:Uncharacterized protein n=1 Tax=Thelazia callipaeda TaxID=103827 RepID=A0A0N5CQD7_THECL|nr:unnamed protein product [Thelazia callipaeda]